VGFIRTWQVRRLRAGALGLVAGMTLLLPLSGSAAAPSAPDSAGPADPDGMTTPTARPSLASAWIVMLQPGALSSGDDGASIRLDTTAGRAVARGRALRTDRAVDRLARVGGFSVTARFGWALQGFSARLTGAQVAALRRDPAVARVVPDAPVSVSADTWPPGIRRVHAGSTQTTSAGDTDVDVAVIDTGIGPVGGPTGTAAELHIAGGHDCRKGGTGNTTDGHGHGTHVAGIIGARDNGVGVVGVAPGARLWSVRVFDAAGRGTTSTVICGIDWVAQWVVQHPGRPIVANMSLRGYDDYAGPTGCDSKGRDTRDPEHQAICTATAAGVVFVVAAGNEREDTDDYIPARYDEVITVAAISDFDGASGGHSTQSAVSGCTPPSGTEKDDTFARYSNYGTAVDIVAPGTCIRSLAPGAGGTVRTAVMSGTSMSAPHVTGAVARYLVGHPAATPAQVRQQVIASGTLDWASGSDPDRTAHPGRALLRLVDVSALASDTPGLVVWPGTRMVSVARGASRVTIPFEFQREGGLDGPVDLSVADLPQGVAIADPGALADITGLRGSLVLDAAPDAVTGDHPLQLTARTSDVRSDAVITLRIDRTPPSIGAPWPRIVFKSGGVYDGSAIVRLAWSASDDSSGIARAELQRLAATWKSLINGGGLTSATSDIQKGVATSYRVRLTDRAGNVGASSVLATQLLLRDSSSPQIEWRGSWRTVGRNTANGRSVRASGGANVTATLPFSGQAVAVVAPRGPGRGKMTITIDGKLAGSVNLNAASVQPRRIVFASGQLAAGPHVIQVTARRSGAELDAFLILE